MLRSSGRSPTNLGAYYFQLRAKGPVTYIMSLTPDKWDWWIEDWVIMRADIHDRSVLLSGAPTVKHGD
jgi:hypothetical protein